MSCGCVRKWACAQFMSIQTMQKPLIWLIARIKIEKDLSYTSVSGAKINVPMPEPQMASPEMIS